MIIKGELIINKINFKTYFIFPSNLAIKWGYMS